MTVPTIAVDEVDWETSAPGARGADQWRQFRRNRLAVVGAAAIVLLLTGALAAPVLTRLGLLDDPLRLDILRANAAPGDGHLLGTDQLGRDVLSRTLYGARVSLSIGLLLQILVLAVGGAVGLAAGFWGGWVDSLLMRVTDITFAFPDLLFVLFVAAVLGPGYWHTFLAVGLVSWPFMARLVRGQVLSIKEQDYVAAARSSGTRPLKLVLRHIVPNALGPVIVTLTFGVPAAVFIEAFLSFVGVGMPPSTPSWGVMVNEGYQAVFAYPHEVLVPACAIAVTTLSFNFLGDGLRDALDPRMRK